jgi:hypothetical protein
MSEPVHIEPGESQLLVRAADVGEKLLEIFDQDVRLGDSESDARIRGQEAPAGDRGPAGAGEGTEIYAHNPGDQTAQVVVSDRGQEAAVDDGFFFDRFPRDTIAGVLGSDSSRTAPARSDDFVTRQATDVDVFAATASESFETPDRADFVVVAVDDATGSFHVEIAYQDADGNDVVVRDDTTDSGLAGDSSTDVLARVAVASPYVEIRIVDDSGGSNILDYSIYAR